MRACFSLVCLPLRYQADFGFYYQADFGFYYLNKQLTVSVSQQWVEKEQDGEGDSGLDEKPKRRREGRDFEGASDGIA